ncbi:MAG: HAD-IIIA family hydrolase, partial [Desulfobacterales bacterium]|nr:HAD-IIIA family hydrolase [Desulfobacterales bacterium]
LITNQSLIGRGWAPVETLEAIFAKMNQGIEAAGGRIADIFYCPHTPDAGCDCRKPKPGLIAQACHTHRIDPAASVMVGDSTKDMGCGRNAGCAAVCLVRTGNGEKSLKTLADRGTPPDFVGDDLMAVARHIISQYSA